MIIPCVFIRRRKFCTIKKKDVQKNLQKNQYKKIVIKRYVKESRKVNPPLYIDYTLFLYFLLYCKFKVGNRERDRESLLYDKRYHYR